MKKIVHVNLGGRPYVLNEDAYETLDKYLHEVNKHLMANPDHDEIIGDIEAAIAVKAAGQSPDAVINLASIKRAITAIGPIDTDDTREATAAPAHEPTAGPRRFYLIPSEGKITGVCAGVAAYLGMDTTLVRVLFVLLLFLTQGMWAVVYLILSVVVSEAKTASEIAEAHGRPVTAQEIITRVEQGIPRNTTAKIGRVLTQSGKILARCIAIVVALGAGLLSAMWAWGLWAIMLGQTTLHGSLAGFTSIKQLVLLTAVYAMCVVPLIALTRLLQRVSTVAAPTTKAGSVLPASIWSVWAVTTVLVVGFTVASANSVRQYVQANDGYLRIGNQQLCVDTNRCGDGIVEKSY